MYELHKELADMKSTDSDKREDVKEVEQQNEQLHSQLFELQEKLNAREQ